MVLRGFFTSVSVEMARHRQGGGRRSYCVLVILSCRSRCFEGMCYLYLSLGGTWYPLAYYIIDLMQRLRSRRLSHTSSHQVPGMLVRPPACRTVNVKAHMMWAQLFQADDAGRATRLPPTHEPTPRLRRLRREHTQSLMRHLLSHCKTRCHPLLFRCFHRGGRGQRSYPHPPDPRCL